MNPLAENADLARQDISRKGENLRENIKDATPSFGSIKASVKSGVDQVRAEQAHGSRTKYAGHVQCSASEGRAGQALAGEGSIPFCG